MHRSDCANAVSLGNEQAMRMIEVDWDGERNSAVYAPASRWWRSTGRGCCVTWPTPSSDHHVNIVACETATGNDRVAKMRFEFELADPGHLAAVLRTIKSINTVYDAYRLVPGKGQPPPPPPDPARSRFPQAKSSVSARFRARESCPPGRDGGRSLIGRAAVPDQPRDA